MKEDEFQKYLVEKLERIYTGLVRENVYLPRTGRYMDIHVDHPVSPLAIEVENDFESVFKGVGQALLYAHETDSTPVVIVPEGCVEEPEANILSKYVNIVEVEVKNG